MNILVLGLGNILLGDEGVGVKAVQRINEAYSFFGTVEVLDGGTAGFDLLDTIADRDCVIIVDAVEGGLEPGEMVRLEDDAVPAYFRTLISPHQLGLAEVLALLKIMDEAPKKVILIGVQPKCLDLSLNLSDLIQTKLDALVDAVLRELKQLGVVATKRTLGPLQSPCRPRTVELSAGVGVSPGVF